MVECDTSADNARVIEEASPNRAGQWYPPSVSFEPKSIRDASSSSCSPTSNRGADATESCTTNAARCSPQQFAHAPPPLSPRFRFAWTKHLPTHSEEWGLPAGDSGPSNKPSSAL